VIEVVNRLLVLLLPAVFGLATGLLRADEGMVVPAVSATASELYPQVSCTSTDPAAVTDAIQLAEETRDRLGPLLKLGPTWRFPVKIRVVTPDDPLHDRVHEEDVAAVLSGKTVELDLAVPSSDPDLREAIQRQYVTAMLWEKFFAPGQVFTPQTRLDIVPVWLIEGLREWLNPDSDNLREAIVKRAALRQNTPSLADIAGWKELSDERLFGLWQRAFSYYLVNSLIHTPAHRADFQQWLDSLTGPKPTDATYLFPTETNWQAELRQSPERSLDLVYTWEQTASEFDSAQTLTFALPEENHVRTCTLDEVPSLPHDKVVIEALNSKIYILTSLELRAHFRWRPIIALYRFALAGFVANHNPDQTQKLFAEAKQDRDAEMAYRQKLTDYANWFEVTHDDSSPTHFASYFSLAEVLDRAQAPRPNPLRTAALQVESEIAPGN
jgi:hypothetical protein